MPTVEYVEASFVGLDTFHSPSKLSPGMMAQCDNLLVDGLDLTTRPGKKGMLTTPFGAPVYEPCPYVKSDGTTDIVFTTGGKLYHAAKGAATAAEVLKGGVSFSLNSPGVFLERAGQFLYGIDGAGALFRTDLATGANMTGLVAPAAPAAALTNSVVDSFSDPTAWTADSLTGAGPTNRLANPTFAGGSDPDGGGHDRTMPHWASFGADTDWYNGPNGCSGTFALLDTPGEGMTSDPVANDAQALDAARKASQFYVSWPYTNTGTSGKDSVISRVIAFASTDGSGAELGRVTHQHAIANIGQQVGVIAEVFTFGETDVPIGSVVLEFEAGPDNTLVDSVYVGAPFLTPIAASVAFGEANPPALTINYNAAQVPITAGTPPVPGQVAFLAGLHLRHTFPAVQDLTGADVLDPVLGANAETLVGLAFKLRLRKSGDTVWYDTNPVTIDSTTASVDITTVPLAVRQACAAIEIAFLSDVTFAGLPQLTIGPLNAAGDLTVGRADYLYQVTEIDASADPTALANILQSNPSAFSTAITPTVTQAEGLLTLPAPTNTGSTHMGLYRAGGGFSDGLARLVAFVSLTANTITFGDGALVSWDHTARRFLDNTPDSSLIGAATAPTGHDAPPVGAQSIAHWQGRICLAKGSRLYISNLIDDDINAGLYFPLVNDPEDPEAAVQGANFAVGGKDNDPIVRLIAYGSHLIILKGRSIWVATGVDAADFQVQSYLLKAGVGCVAPRAAGIVGNVVWFRSATGLMQFDADVVDPVSVAIEKTIALATGYAGGALAYHGRRMYLFSPDAGSNVNSVAFVYDSRQNGYTRYLNMNVTSAASLSGGQDTDDFYLAGLDGQIYHLSGSGDQATPAASVVPVAFSVNTRGFHGGDIAHAQVPGLVYFSVLSRETVALTVGVKDADTSASSSQVYTVGGSDSTPAHATPRLRAGGGLRAPALQVTLSGSAAKPFRILSLGLVATGGRRL